MSDETFLFNVVWGSKQLGEGLPIERVMLAKRNREVCLTYVENYFSMFEQAGLNIWAVGEQYVKLERAN